VIDLTVTASDGSLSASDRFSLTVTPVNDTPAVSADVKLSSIVVNSGADLITQAQLLANASDVDGPTLAAVNLQIAKGRGTLVDNHDGTWSYTPKINDDSSVTFSYQVTDGIAAPVTAGATLDIAPAQAAPQIGSSGNDTFTAVTGNAEYDAGLGTDTITFNFKLTEATVTYSGNHMIIDGPSSHTVLSGFEIYKFTDGTVNNADSDPLVDDLYYYSHNHDVWNAGVDADAHYHTFGWQEGRDPNAYFSTSTYLSLNPSVKASGADPLVQFDHGGLKGSDPSISFDVAAYLNANPDVKAAGVDPLLQYLANGYQEGRAPIAPATLVASNGFDYVYYLQHNPDVAAAHVDPLQHYETVGWKEGRNPNAYFDVNGYLAHNPDVAATGMNPLDHYDQFGWKESRDPSASFDTKAYLAAYPDVAAAHVDPLLQYLQHGMAEGRTPHGDGLWG
jgi:Cadherin-like domain